MGDIFTKKPLRKTLKSLYEDINTAVDNTAIQTPANGSVTNAKLATDVKVGSLATLNTSEKASVVGAINENFAAIAAGPVAGSITNTALATDVKVGSLATLTTAAKGSIVAAINELVTRVAALELT
jgi:hypothetical protein